MDYVSDGFAELREECVRISSEITEASYLIGGKRTSEYQKLLTEILELKKQDPNSEVFELHSLLGLMLLRTDQQRAALAEFKLSLQLVQGNELLKNDASGIWYNMGIAYMELNMFEDAFKCFQSSIDLKPHNIKCFISMAVVKQMQGDFKTSYEILCDVLKNHKPQASEIEKVFISLGYTLLRSKNLTGAMECADKILQQVNIDSEKALKLKGTVYHAQGHHKEAWECCGALFNLSPNSLEGHLLAGTFASSEKDYRKAFFHYNKARRVGRSYNFTLYNSIATALSKLQKFQLALKIYRYILSIDQNPIHRSSVSKSITFFEKMQVRKLLEQDEASKKNSSRMELPAFEVFKEASKFLDNGNLEKAIEMLKKASEAEGGEQIWEIDNAIGRAYYKMRDFTNAIPHFEKAAQLSGNAVTVLHNLASSLTRNKEHQKSLEVIERLLEIQPDFHPAKKMHAVLLGKLGKYNDSASYLTKILEKEPQDAYSLVSMGRVYQEKGEYVKAHECFVQLLAKEPESEQAIMSIAINYSRANNLKQSVNFLKSYLERNPQSFPLNLTLANILRFHKKFSHAEEYYRTCAKNYNREAYDGLADCICQMGRLDEAMVYYEKIVEMEKNNPYSIYAKKSIAFIYRLKQEYAKALDVYQEINWDADYFFATWRNVAQCYTGLAVKQKNIGGATSRRGVSYYTKALKLYETIKEKEVSNPKHCARIDSLIAELHICKGHYANACEIYQTVIQSDYYFLIWKTYANCLITQQLFKEALELCFYVLEKFSKDGKTRYVPESLNSYKASLELAVGGDSEAIEQITQKASESLSNMDWQNQEN
ncbi:MAG: tetratricopeptide repeat protein [Fibromonadaceae bacterium]|jgi:tetratricopeptide (TPR) repeat protein|nr:tetratricopeptide repeat protein [Fibromonadaceae bacterium]